MSYRVNPEPEILRSIWVDADKSHRGHSIFQTYEWQSPWQRHFGGEFPIINIVDAGTKSIVPLCVNVHRRFGMDIRYLQFSGMPLSDYGGIVGFSSSAQSLVDFLKEDVSRWDALELERLSLSMPLERMSNSLEGAGFHVSIRFWGNHYPISLTGDFGDYTRSLSKKMRDDLKRLERRLEKKGDVTFHVAANWNDAESICEKCVTFHRRRWTSSRSESLFDSELNLSLFKEIWRETWRARRLHASALRSDGEIVAAHVGFIYNSMFHYNFPTFDMDHANASPGKVLLYKLIEWASRNEIGVFDLGYGDLPYKRWFGGRMTKLVTLTATNKRLASSLIRMKRGISEGLSRFRKHDGQETA